MDRHFTALVVGENPQEIIEKYDSKKRESKPYIVYEFKKKKEYRLNKIASYEKLINNWPKDENQEELLYLKDCVDDWKKMDDIDFFLEISEDYDIDEKTGDAISDKNRLGKYDFCNIGKNFSLPFILKDGSETYSARKCDIDWSKIHLYNVKPYEVAWDTVMEHKKPKNDDEKIIYENMKERIGYFSSFGTRENYVASCSSFWAYAFVTNKEWIELEYNMDQFEWVKNFYDRFIKPLPNNAILTIYECYRP